MNRDQVRGSSRIYIYVQRQWASFIIYDRAGEPWPTWLNSRFGLSTRSSKDLIRGPEIDRFFTGCVKNKCYKFHIAQDSHDRILTAVFIFQIIISLIIYSRAIRRDVHFAEKYARYIRGKLAKYCEKYFNIVMADLRVYGAHRSFIADSMGFRSVTHASRPDCGDISVARGSSSGTYAKYQKCQ